MKKITICILLSQMLSFASVSRAVIPDRAEADVIIGQQLPGPANFFFPVVAVDPVTQKVFVGDEKWNRILRFASAASLNNGAAAEAVLGQPDFTSVEKGGGANGLNYPLGLWCDGQGRLWVSDTLNCRVLRFDQASTLASGAPASGVLGQVNFTNSSPGTSASTLRYPHGLVTDAYGNLYVVDKGNDRVLRFNNAAALPAGAAASAVFGQADFTSSEWGQNDATHLYSPSAVAISPNPVLIGRPYLWVADTANDRVVLYPDAPHAVSGVAATRVLGQPDLDSYGHHLTVNGIPGAASLAADASGRLYVGSNYDRILRFDNAVTKPNFAPADGVLGQAAFTTSDPGTGPGSLDGPLSLAIGTGGRLWIAERHNHRVTRHEAAHAKVNGADADGVLGASSTTTDMSRRFNARDIAIDPVSGKLFALDTRWNRVLRFASVQSLVSGAGAEAVFGQSSFSGTAEGTGANRMDEPSGIDVDAFGNLWVADYGNHRVLRFNNAAQRASGTGADGVLGQSNFTSHASLPVSAVSLTYPRSVSAGPSGELWVAHSSRVLRFDNARNKGNGAPADGVLGQADFTNNGNVTLDAFHFGPNSVFADPSGRLWVSDSAYHRILRFDGAAGKINGAPADGVLGQDNFVTGADGGVGPDGVSYSQMAIEPNGRLWVTDANQSRVLRWENAAARPNGADADGVVGQPDFGFEEQGSGPGQFSAPMGICRDSSGRLWIADANNDRIMRFSPEAPRLDIAPKNAVAATLTLNRHARGVPYLLESSGDLTGWFPEQTWTPNSSGQVALDVPVYPGSRGYFRIREE